MRKASDDKDNSCGPKGTLFWKHHAEKSYARICVLYSALIATLLIILPVFGYFSYTILHANENSTFRAIFTSLSDDIFLELTVATAQIDRGVNVMATFVEATQPEENQWPNITVPNYGLMNKRIESLSGTSYAICVLVQPEQADGFTAHALNVFNNTPDIPSNSGIHPFGPGIYRIDENGTRYKDTTGVVSFSEYTFLTPLLYSQFPEKYAALLYNLHSSIRYASGKLNYIIYTVPYFIVLSYYLIYSYNILINILS